MGVFLYQYSLFLTLILIPLSFLSLFLLGKKGIALILSAFFFFMGGTYTLITEKVNLAKAHPFTESEKSITGTVISIPETESYGQSAVLLSEGVKIRLMTSEGVLKYKDTVSFMGKCSFPEEKSRPLAFDYNTYLKSEDIYLTVFVTDINILGNSASLFNPIDAVTILRSKAIERSSKLWSDEHLMFAIAILLGDSSYSSSAFRDKLSEGSISHIIAVSGTHVSLVSLLFLLILKRFSQRKKYLYFLTLPVVIFFVLFTGASPSAIRAATMFSLFILATATLSFYDGFTSLSSASFILLLINPFVAFSLSYILSFSAVFGILLFTKPFEEALSFIPVKWLKTSLSVTLAAQIFTILTLSLSFGRVPFLSLLANLLVVPLVPFIMASGYLALILSFVPDKINIFTYLFDILSSACIKIAEAASKLPLANIYPVFQFLPLFIACILFFIAFFVFTFIFKKKKTGIVLLCITILSFTLNHFYPALNGEKAVYFLDSGHGDCTVILNGSHISIIDCTSSDKDFLEYTLMPFMRQKGFYALDDVILSEYNKHDEAFSSFINTVKAERVLLPESSSDEFSAQFPHIKVIPLSSGQKLDLSGVILETVYESGGISSYKITVNEKSVLIPGNITAKAEKQLSDRVSDCDVLKAPRHGNKDSCSEDLLNSVTPEAIIVSTGRNLSEDFKKRLSGYKVYSTKINGDITVNCNTKEIIPYKKVK